MNRRPSPVQREHSGFTARGSLPTLGAVIRRLPAIALLLVALAGLVLALDADPSRLLWRDFITDEGWWTAEARDRVLFGDWVTDEYNQGLAVPAATWAWRASFEAFGVSLLSARLPSLLAGLLTLLLLGLMLRRDGADVARGALLLASALPFAMHARVAMPELPSLLGVTAAWWLLSSGRRGAQLLGGLAFGLALSAKFSAIVALPPLFWIARGAAGPAWSLPAGGGPVERVPLIARWRRSVNFTFAALVAWSLLRLPFGLAFPDALGALESLYRGENLPANPIDLLANLAYFPFPAPFLYHTAPLLALAGVGAWAAGLEWRRRDLAGQALAFLLMGGLTQALFLNPADRRFLLFLPALAILALRGWRALASGETLPGFHFRKPNLAAMLAASFALAAVLPGRLAIWWGRLRNMTGEPLPDERLRALAAGLFILTLVLGLIWLARRPRHLSTTLGAGLLIGWILLCLEHFDFLAWAGLFHALGRYDASRLWLEMGGPWSVFWALATLLPLWLALARAGLLPGARLEGSRARLPWLAPILGLAILLPNWTQPSFTLRDAADDLAAPPVELLVGPEAPTLAIGSEARCVVPRGAFNAGFLDDPPPNSRLVTLVEDSGELASDWPEGARRLELCPQSDGKPRFVLAVQSR